MSGSQGLPAPQKIAESGRRLAAAARRKPLPTSVGVFYNTNHPGFGDAFLWFESHDALASCLSEDLRVFHSFLLTETLSLPSLPAEPEPRPPLSSDRSLEPAWESLERCGIRVVWYGNFEQLVGGEGEFPCHVRASYRKAARFCALEDCDAPIGPRERHSFRRFLRAYRKPG